MACDVVVTIEIDVRAGYLDAMLHHCTSDLPVQLHAAVWLELMVQLMTSLSSTDADAV